MADGLNRTIDTLLLLEDGVAAIAASAVSSNDILDVGAGHVEGHIYFDFSALVVTTDEIYQFILQGSTSPTHASVIENLAILDLAKAANKIAGADVVGATGQYIIPFSNSVDGGRTTYRYLRLYNLMSGTAESATYKAYLTK